MQVFSVVDGTVYGETEASNAFWQTLLAGGKNVFNLGGNIETTNLDAPPLLITLDGLTCLLKEVRKLLLCHSLTLRSCSRAKCMLSIYYQQE